MSAPLIASKTTQDIILPFKIPNTQASAKMSTTKTPITELALPIFKDDTETLSTIQSQGNEIFGHLAGVAGVQFIAYGFVIYDEGKKLDSSSRGVLLLGTYTPALLLDWN